MAVLLAKEWYYDGFLRLSIQSCEICDQDGPMEFIVSCGGSQRRGGREAECRLGEWGHLDEAIADMAAIIVAALAGQHVSASMRCRVWPRTMALDLGHEPERLVLAPCCSPFLPDDLISCDIDKATVGLTGEMWRDVLACLAEAKEAVAKC